MDKDSSVLDDLRHLVQDLQADRQEFAQTILELRAQVAKLQAENERLRQLQWPAKDQPSSR